VRHMVSSFGSRKEIAKTHIQTGIVTKNAYLGLFVDETAVSSRIDLNNEALWSGTQFMESYESVELVNCEPTTGKTHDSNDENMHLEPFIDEMVAISSANERDTSMRLSGKKTTLESREVMLRQTHGRFVRLRKDACTGNDCNEENVYLGLFVDETAAIFSGMDANGEELWSGTHFVESYNSIQFVNYEPTTGGSDMTTKIADLQEVFAQKPEFVCGICGTTMYPEQRHYRAWTAPLSPLAEKYPRFGQLTKIEDERMNVCQRCRKVNEADAQERSGELDLREIPREVALLSIEEKRALSAVRMYGARYRPGPHFSTYIRFRGTGPLSTSLAAWSQYAGFIGNQPSMQPGASNFSSTAGVALRKIMEINPLFATVPRPGETLDWYLRVNSYQNRLEDDTLRMPADDADAEVGNEDQWFEHLPAGEEIVNGLTVVRSWAFKDLEGKMFPTLYPYGEGIINLEANKGVASEVRRRMLCVDDRWRRSSDWLFALFDIQEKRRLHYEQQRVLKNGRSRDTDQPLTAANILESSSYQKRDRLHEEFTVAVPHYIRGHRRYWKAEHGNLLTYISMFGKPHLFLTFSCFETGWPDVRDLCNGGMSTNYPVEVTRHMERRFRKFFDEMILAHDGIFRPHRVKEYYWRTEFQKRGSPHWHLVLWLENVSTADELFGYVSAHVPVEDHELATIVRQCQRHQHRTDRCFRTGPTCQYGFPRDLSEKSQLSEDGHRIVYKRLTEEDRWINTYNAEALRAWRGNMDIQICTSASVVRYLAKYITKAEPEVEEHDTQRRNSIGQYLQDRDYGLAEVCYYLLGYHISHGSRKVWKIPLGNVEAEEHRTLKSASQLKAMEEDSTDVEHDNMLDKYMGRPSALEHITILEYFAAYHVGGKKEGDLRDSKNRAITKRQESKRALVRWYPFLTSWDGESYYRQQLLLKTPFRSTREIEQWNGNHRRRYLEVMDMLTEDVEDLQEDSLENSEGTRTAALSDVNILREMMDPVSRGAFDNELLFLQELRRTMNTASASANVVNSLTEEQYEVFCHVRSVFESRMSGRLLGLLGSGGTGKSYLLRTIIEFFQHKKAQTLILASTGVAAMLIGGQTLHSALQVRGSEVDGYTTLMFKPEGRWSEIQKIEVLIVDEVSMISAQLLDFVNGLFQRGHQQRKPFGGILVILCGDLYQLPPVEGDGCWRSSTWSQTRVLTLKMSIRHGRDQMYGAFLDRLRVGELEETDHAFLRTMLYDDTRDRENFRQAPILVATRKRAKAINATRLNALFGQERIYQSADQILDERGNIGVDNDSIERQSRLHGTLTLKVGCRVMLLRNIDVAGGLVNGTIGTVYEVEDKLVGVVFQCGVEMKRVEVRRVTFRGVAGGVRIARRQFPLMLAWGLTVHKAQGLTLGKVIVDEIEGFRTYGQFYVAMSRVRTSEDIRLQHIPDHLPPLCDMDLARALLTE
jgi:PIF1-like helicase/Helitron helicase-like domain at N-terminus